MWNLSRTPLTTSGRPSAQTCRKMSSVSVESLNVTVGWNGILSSGVMSFVDKAGDLDLSLWVSRDNSDAEVDGEMGRRGLDTGSEVDDVVATSMS